MSKFVMNGQDMHDLMAKLFPICRSLTGPGNRDSLDIMGEHLPIVQHEVASGTKCFDWIVPDEWHIRSAWIETTSGERVVDFADHNLHLVSYSEPIDAEMSYDELLPHLHSLPEQPDAIPYVTSFYSRRWGFCMRHRDLEKLSKDARYRVRIDSDLFAGHLTYGECILPGESAEEILLSTNICHPSMANNELSGPVMLTAIGTWLQSLPHRRYTYRLLYLPETVGAVAYLSQHSKEMIRSTVAGYQVVCVGGPGPMTMIKTRRGDSLSDRMALHALKHSGDEYRVLEYKRRASDERQYNSPGIDIPVAVLARSLFLDYDEYHTSLDDLEFVTSEQLQNTLEHYQSILSGLEANRHYLVTHGGCEPQLGRRGLYNILGGGRVYFDEISELLAYADGSLDLLAIAEIHDKSMNDFTIAIEKLLEAELIKVVE